MAFAQLTYRESPREHSACSDNAEQAKLFHMGIAAGLAQHLARRPTSARTGGLRGLRLVLIVSARRLYAGDKFGADLEGAAYALDTNHASTCACRCSPGPVPPQQGRGKAAHHVGPAGQHTRLVHIRRQVLRHRHPGRQIFPKSGAIDVMTAATSTSPASSARPAGAFFVVRAKDNQPLHAASPPGRSIAPAALSAIRLSP